MKSLLPSLSFSVVGPLAFYAAGLFVAAATDLRSRRIPNWVVAPLVLIGISYNAEVAGWSGALRGLAGFGVGIGLLFLPFTARLIGGGDVKLLGSVGAWVGPGAILSVALLTAVLCGALVVALLLRHPVLRRQVSTNLKNMALMQRVAGVEARPRSQTVPVGAAMAAAGLWVALGGRAFPGV